IVHTLESGQVRERGTCFRVRIVADHIDLGTAQSPRHVRAHTTQPHHADLQVHRYHLVRSAMLHKRHDVRYALHSDVRYALRHVARSAAAMINAAPPSIRAPGTSPSSAKASAMPYTGSSAAITLAVCADTT